jgi:AcrR family transcriptional regulator
MALTKDELIKSAIIEAAQKLFQQFGLAKTTMEDIAKAVGKGKSSIYYYYATKENIFEAVVEKEAQSIESDIVTAIEKETSACEKLNAFAHSRHKALRKRQLLYKIMIHSFEENMCVFNVIKQRFSETEYNIIQSIIIYGIETGEFDKAHGQPNTVMATKICRNTFKGLQMELSFGNYKDSAIDLIDATVNFVISGLKNC